MSNMNNVNSQMVNSNIYLFLRGVGQLIALELLFVTGGENKPEPGEATDVTAKHLIRFEPQNPHSTEEKKMVIRNSTYVAGITRVMFCDPGGALICDTKLSEAGEIFMHLIKSARKHCFFLLRYLVTFKDTLVRAGTLCIDQTLWEPLAMLFGSYAAKLNVFASV